VAVVTVEEISGRAAFKRFFEFPYLEFREEPRWSAPVVAYERKRLDPHHPYFDQGDGEYFLARRMGKVAGRIAAHIADRDVERGDKRGWFGFFDTVDDAAVVEALVGAAREWLGDHGCTTINGLASFTAGEELGILVEGFDVAGTTGRPWHPPWYAAHLEAAGLTRVPDADHPTWRLSCERPGIQRPPGHLNARASTDPWSGGVDVVGRFVDPRIVLPGIVAVPDLTPARNSAIAMARRAKRNDWEGCTIVAIDGDPAVYVPDLLKAAAGAGYQWVVSPWSPDPDAAPETRHGRYELGL